MRGVDGLSRVWEEPLEWSEKALQLPGVMAKSASTEEAAGKTSRHRQSPG